MPISIVRLGNPRKAGEGLRLGTVRRPPRGVRAKDYARLDYYDLWLPELSPEPALIKRLLSNDRKEWNAFSKAYTRQMARPAERRLLQLLAALSQKTNLSVGCYCEDESTCHRSILKELLKKEGALLSKDQAGIKA